MSYNVQDGRDVSYKLDGDITEVSPYGRAMVYSGEVVGAIKLGAEGDTKFAGIFVTVTITRSQQSPFNTEAYDGDQVTAKKYGMVEVVADGAVEYGDPLCIGEDGALKVLEDYDISPTDEQHLLYLGRAESEAADGEKFVARIIPK
jgi:hypothetical protein